MEKELLKNILMELRETKEGVKEANSRLTNVEGKLTSLEKDMTEMKTDMAEVKGRLTSLEKDMTEVKTRLKKVEELVEFNQENIEAIKHVVMDQYNEFRNFVNENNVEHIVYNTKLLKFNKEN